MKWSLDYLSQRATGAQMVDEHCCFTISTSDGKIFWTICAIVQRQRMYLYKCSNGTSRQSCQYKHICFKADSVTWCEIHSLVHYYVSDGTWIELTCSNSTALLENIPMKPYTQLTIDTITLQSQKTAAGKKPRKPKWRSSKSEMALLQVGELLLIDYICRHCEEKC